MSIIQGSGVGPTLYIIMEGDLKPISSINTIFIYADDTNLMVPEITDVCLLEEFDIMKKWAEINGMHLNLAKTKEIKFRRPNPHFDLIPQLLDTIVRVDEAKIPGLFFPF